MEMDGEGLVSVRALVVRFGECLVRSEVRDRRAAGVWSHAEARDLTEVQPGRRDLLSTLQIARKTGRNSCYTAEIFKDFFKPETGIFGEVLVGLGESRVPGG